MSKNLYLIITGLLIEIAFLFFLFSQNDSKSIILYIIVFAITTIVTLSLYYYFKKSSEELDRIGLLIIISFALLFRVTLLFSSPSTSDDVYRYIWEGKLVVNGINPFEVKPNSLDLNYLHSETLPEKVSFPHMTTIYPPVAQLVFAAGYLISGENDFGIKLIYLIAEMITILFLLKILRFYRIEDFHLLLYAWLALPIMEYFINSHIDVIGIMFFVMTIYYFLKNQFLQFSFAYAFAILSKLFPLFFVFIFIKKLGLKKSFNYGLIVLLIVILFTYPFIPEEREISASLFTYLSQWSFNGSVYKILNGIMSNVSSARLISLVLFGSSVIYISYKISDSLKAIYFIWIAYIIFTPTLYPWYLGWIAVVNPLFGFASVNSLLLTVNVSNFTTLSIEWKEYWWAALVQYLPFYGLLIWDFLKTKRSLYETSKTESS